MRTEWIENLIIAACLLLFLSLTSCASTFTAKTDVTVEHLPDGTCRASFSSNKEETNLKAEVCGGKISVEKAGTLESVVAAVAATQASIAKTLEVLTAAAKAGALAGS